MSEPERFDIIIAGAGAAGLSLLWKLLKSNKLKESRILLIDSNLKPTDDKTWCFWDDQSVQLDEFIYHTWNTLEVTAHKNNFIENLSKYSYNCIRSMDYSRRIIGYAKQSENVTLLETEILGFSAGKNFAEVKTSAGKFKAPWIFQSALKPPGLEQSKTDISLMQHFMGWEITTQQNLFKVDKATLMDFDIPQSNGVTFLYVLPFSKNKALIEYTLFSGQLLTEDEYENGLKNYLRDKYDLTEGSYTIQRKEKGVIPMEDRRYPAWYCDRVLNMGTMGGLTKPSTGYTFTRIQRHSNQIVKALKQETAPPVSGVSSYRFRVYDMMLLYLLKNDVSTSIIIFRELFKRNRFDRILEFLEEKTDPGQEIKIFASLPYLPFFKAIWKMKHRILTGA